VCKPIEKTGLTEKPTREAGEFIIDTPHPKSLHRHISQLKIKDLLLIILHLSNYCHEQYTLPIKQ
jgi:hypothetical protein